MKKYSVLFLCVAFLTGCTAASPKTPVETEATAAATTVTTVTTTASDATTALSEKEQYWREEFEQCAELQAESLPTREYVEITSDTKFYECEYTRERVAEAECGENVKQAFYDSELYKNLLAQADEVRVDYENERLVVNLSCKEVLTCDFDNDGAEEKAYLLALFPEFPQEPASDEASPHVALFYSLISPNSDNILVVENSKGEFTVSDCLYAMDSALYELRYNGFSHLVVNGGVSNSSSCADYFSVTDGRFRLELREFRAYDIMDGIFLAQTMAQASNMWLIFWNEENKCYVTPEATYLKGEQIDERLSEYSTGYAAVIGNSIYGFVGEVSNSYILTERGIEFAAEKMKNSKLWLHNVGERKTDMNSPFCIPYAKNFDYETALDNTVPLE